MMKSSLTAGDVLADIEFELMQGAISRDELGQSIQLIRQHQNKIRSQAFPPGAATVDPHEILSQQFKLNDMLITILHEMAGSMQEMQQKINWVGQARHGQKTAVSTLTPPLSTSGPSTDDALLRPTDSLNKAMQLDAIYQTMQTQPARFSIPFINGISRWLRVSLHNLVLFYVNMLAKKQATVNHTVGNWILHLNALNRHRQEELELVLTRIAELQEAISNISQEENT